jgi:hypothetical protein
LELENEIMDETTNTHHDDPMEQTAIEQFPAKPDRTYVKVKKTLSKARSKK